MTTKPSRVRRAESHDAKASRVSVAGLARVGLERSVGQGAGPGRGARTAIGGEVRRAADLGLAGSPGGAARAQLVEPQTPTHGGRRGARVSPDQGLHEGRRQLQAELGRRDGDLVLEAFAQAGHGVEQREQGREVDLEGGGRQAREVNHRAGHHRDTIRRELHDRPLDGLGIARVPFGPAGIELVGAGPQGRLEARDRLHERFEPGLGGRALDDHGPEREVHTRPAHPGQGLELDLEPPRFRRPFEDVDAPELDVHTLARFMDPSAASTDSGQDRLRERAECAEHGPLERLLNQPRDAYG
jgi:hypothetical protein